MESRLQTISQLPPARERELPRMRFIVGIVLLLFSFATNLAGYPWLAGVAFGVGATLILTDAIEDYE